MRLPGDTGDPARDVCAACGKPFEQYNPWIIGVRDASGERRVIHGGCNEAWSLANPSRPDNRPRMRPRKPEAFT